MEEIYLVAPTIREPPIRQKRNSNLNKTSTPAFIARNCNRLLYRDAERRDRKSKMGSAGYGQQNDPSSSRRHQGQRIPKHRHDYLPYLYPP
jgi:hypothetical protein